MKHVGRNLDGRFQHESPPRHAWMRHNKRGRVDHRVAIQQQIEVERSRRPAVRSHAAQFILDLQKARK